MDTKQVNDTLCLIASIAMAEMEKAGSSKDYTAEIAEHITALPNDVAEVVNYLWDSLINCAEQTSKG